MNLTHRIVVVLFLGLLMVPAIARAQDSPAKQPRLPQTVESFRAMEPSERSKTIEKLALPKSPFATVTKGDLIAAIVERGAIEPAICVDVICKIKAPTKDNAPTTIKWVIDEGSWVKKGERLISFDDSAIHERVVAAKVKAQATEAAMVQAAVSAELAKQEGEIDVRLAEIEVKFVVVELKAATTGSAKDTLELKLERAKLQLERAKIKSKAQQVAADAEKRARAAAAELEMQRLREVEAELNLCELTAPIDGLVVYEVPSTGRLSSTKALIAQGEPVREGQKLLRICEMKHFAVATRVHEAVISTVRTGQPTQVRIDAFPGRVLDGKVNAVSPTAAAADFMMKDVKVYSVVISIEAPPPGLKPQMTAEVQIKTGERKGVLQVPLTAVLGSGRDRFCFVKDGQEIVEKKIAVGASSAASVEIREGLKEGDEVLANPGGLFGPPAKGKAK
jgi:RND family efflux transporter MFP subunit